MHHPFLRLLGLTLGFAILGAPAAQPSSSVSTQERHGANGRPSVWKPEARTSFQGFASANQAPAPFQHPTSRAARDFPNFASASKISHAIRPSIVTAGSRPKNKAGLFSAQKRLKIKLHRYSAGGSSLAIRMARRSQTLAVIPPPLATHIAARSLASIRAARH
jgi:hypothetical protein